VEAELFLEMPIVGLDGIRVSLLAILSDPLADEWEVGLGKEHTIGVWAAVLLE
jgi:hypothetical protein